MTVERPGSPRGWVVGVGLLVTLFVGTAVLAGVAPTGAAGRDPSQRYEGDVTVLESRPPGRGTNHGPELCDGRDSFPPHCDGFPVEPFRWADVDGKQSAFGTTWARVHLVATFDGHAFHPTAMPSPPRPGPGPEPLGTSPCPPPAGGWTVVDESKVSEADLSAAWAYANAQPDVAAVWGSWPKGLPEPEPSWPKGPPTSTVSYHDAVINMAFTGDLDRHAREARALWGGGLCVTHMARTRTQLTGVSDDLFKADTQAQAVRAGVYLLAGGPDEPTNVVKVDVLIADNVAQEWVDNRYGPGIIVLKGSLQPVP